MKAYTDLNQSRKLAEILPIESADMTWVEGEWDKPIIGKIMQSPDEDYTFIPCWSLAALLNYLREIDSFPEIATNEFGVTMNISYYDMVDGCRFALIHCINVKAESFIDACYEIIVKLNNQKLL